MAGVAGRVAVITGASQGIGRACALMFAAAGAQVAVAARNQEKLDVLVAEIAAAGGAARAFKMDVGNQDEVKAGFKAIVGEFGKIDILLNNAGITRDQLAMRMKMHDWDSVLQTNLTGPFLCSQQVIAPMLRQQWGRIVNVTSIFGQTGQAGQVNYSASKAGLIGLTMALARELASRGITVNAIAPGFIQTAMTESLPAELREKVNAMIPLGRPGADADVAHAALFLASEEAGYITGHVLNVNGGMLMG